MVPLLDYVPKLREATEVQCKGVYCGMPSYFPISHMLKRNWFLPAGPPPGASSKLVLESVKKTSSNSRNYTFIGHFPPNARLHLQPLPGYSLLSWSLESFIPPVTPYGDEGLGCYYIMYTRGNGGGETKLWIEVKGDIDVSPVLEVSLISVYINPPSSTSDELQQLLSLLPSWVSTISWTSIMDNMTF
ncbi:PREDICTED: endoplasmic reticulum metallopeptidase 1-like [Amphimedon queenslandica]|uniref:Endoplasmic reticulum metallopeptidase 1-like C-terminal domain-containing protein n=1 Tax=Amphimedon queenslandica TaxID=400682 RepID=A0A1X7TSL8_AMPQE|nr:PREDICTED: endoplasmic reticulum metallopeptidase 1-like [Amphimedon queenslandica]|eukprot:XP_019857887.1 PREDICTED: endoplasmic reticulum metallopeptidase 1-like [Amphimedon queenslandica]